MAPNIQRVPLNIGSLVHGGLVVVKANDHKAPGISVSSETYWLWETPTLDLFSADSINKNLLLDAQRNLSQHTISSPVHYNASNDHYWSEQPKTVSVNGLISQAVSHWDEALLVHPTSSNCCWNETWAVRRLIPQAEAHWDEALLEHHPTSSDWCWNETWAARRYENETAPMAYWDEPRYAFQWSDRYWSGNDLWTEPLEGVLS